MLGMDALRYFLLREVVFGQDGNFSYDALVTRYNSDLANGLGNLASRTVALIEKNFAGKIPKPGARQPQDDALAKEAQAAIGEVLERYDKMEFSRALETIWSVIGAADKYLTAEQPWALGTSEADQARKATILWTVAELLRIVVALAIRSCPRQLPKSGRFSANPAPRTLLSWTACAGGNWLPALSSVNRKRYSRVLTKRKQ